MDVVALILALTGNIISVYDLLQIQSYRQDVQKINDKFRKLNRDLSDEEIRDIANTINLSENDIIQELEKRLRKTENDIVNLENAKSNLKRINNSINESQYITKEEYEKLKVNIDDLIQRILKERILPLDKKITNLSKELNDIKKDVQNLKGTNNSDLEGKVNSLSVQVRQLQSSIDSIQKVLDNKNGSTIVKTNDIGILEEKSYSVQPTQYLDQIYTIPEAKTPLIPYNVSKNQLEKILNKVKELQPIKDFFLKNANSNSKLENAFDKIYTKANKSLSISNFEDLDSSEYSEFITSNSVADIVQSIVKNILENAITNRRRYLREKNNTNIKYYCDLINSIRQYFESINVYTYQCEKNSNWNNVNKYFTEKSYPTTTTNTALDGVVSEIVYPPHVLKYIDDSNRLDYRIIEGKCKYYNILES